MSDGAATGALANNERLRIAHKELRATYVKLQDLYIGADKNQMDMTRLLVWADVLKQIDTACRELGTLHD